ncbi:hypothetical protein [Yoonia sp. 2307UL14-13]|uniref:hypothetical protein n=1 Tax=Yoonia sp. 2307UL14-13 TaxID=3126506 RepID=UPI0030A363B0
MRDSATVRHWVYVEALLTPGFFALPEAVAHFRDTYGDPDTKARDLIQMIKVTLRSNGRAAEIWW